MTKKRFRRVLWEEGLRSIKVVNDAWGNLTHCRARDKKIKEKTLRKTLQGFMTALSGMTYKK